MDVGLTPRSLAAASGTRARAFAFVFASIALPVVKYLQITARPAPPGTFDTWALGRQAMLIVVVSLLCLATVRDASPAQLARVLLTRVPPPAVGERRRLWLWTLLPGASIMLGVALYLVGPGDAHVDVTRLAELVVVTVIGEELLFRGLLPVLSVDTLGARVRLVGPSLAFGLWHVPDAIARSADLAAWLHAGIGFAATAAAAGFVLLPLRLQCRSLLGPMLVHGATNGGLIVLGLSTFS